jgi:hypothetical protein
MSELPSRRPGRRVAASRVSVEVRARDPLYGSKWLAGAVHAEGQPRAVSVEGRAVVRQFIGPLADVSAGRKR